MAADPQERKELVEWARTLTAGWSFYATLTFRPEKCRRCPDRNPSQGCPIPKDKRLPHLMPCAHRRDRTLSVQTAVQRFKSWLYQRDKSAREGFWRGVLWSVEPHQTGAPHIHALFERTPEPMTGHCRSCADGIRFSEPEWKQWNESWYYHHGIARFYVFDPARGFGAENYVLKSILSENMLDWGIES